MATKKTNITLAKDDANQQLKSFCEQSEIMSRYKSKVDELRPNAAAELLKRLDSDPETKDYTGTVVYICGDKNYKIRVQRPDNTDWTKKTIKDKRVKQLKDLKKTIKEKEKEAKELENDLAIDHPKCIDRGFVISFLSK